MDLKRTKKLGVVLGLTFASTLAGPVAADDYKVFLLGGQSNMDGRADASGLPTSPVNLQQPQTDVIKFESGISSNWQDLQPRGSQFGPEILFGRTLADALPGENIALIKYAASGTNLYSDWDPAGSGDPNSPNRYERFVDSITAGLNKLTTAGHTYEIAGMLWTQGEADALNDQTTVQYQTNLNGLIAEVRSSYGSDLPFFLSQLSDNQTTTAAREAKFDLIQAAQTNVASSDPNAYLIDTNSFSVISGDEIHFDAGGQIALGTAFAQSYLTNVPEPGSLALLGLGGLLIGARRRRD